MLRAAPDESDSASRAGRRQEVSRYERGFGVRAVRDKHQQTIVRESVKTSRYNALRDTNGAAPLPSCSASVSQPA